MTAEAHESHRKHVLHGPHRVRRVAWWGRGGSPHCFGWEYLDGPMRGEIKWDGLVGAIWRFRESDGWAQVYPEDAAAAWDPFCGSEENLWPTSAPWHWCQDRGWLFTQEEVAQAGSGPR